MTRIKRPILALIISCLAFIAAGAVIWFLPPAGWLIEVGVLALISVGLWLGSSWIIGRRKWANLVVTFLIVVLLLNRWGILNWITLGLWVAIIGLLSLIN